MPKKWYAVVGVLMLAGYLLPGCGGSEVDIEYDDSAIRAGSDETQMLWAVKTGDIGKVKELLDKYPDAVNVSGGKLLQSAARFGKANIVKLLIERGVDVNDMGGEGMTPLATAKDVDYDNDDVIQILEAAGAEE